MGKYQKKGTKPTKPKTKRRVKRSGDVAEYASLSVKRSLAPSGGGNYIVNALYSMMNTQLSDYQRAVQVAQAYQHYRIKNIKLTFKPTYDTFMNGGQSKMHLYYMIDKSGSIPTNTSLEGLKQMGARPFALDENNRIVSWAPTVLEASMTAPPGVTTPSKYQKTPWLTTSANIVSPGVFAPSSVDHLGIYWWCEQLVTAGTVTQYEVECEVQFEFKKPLVYNLTSSVNAIPSKPADIDESPDGIVGGPDGI